MAEFGTSARDAITGVLPVLLSERIRLIREDDCRDGGQQLFQQRGQVLGGVKSEVNGADLARDIRRGSVAHEFETSPGDLGSREQEGLLAGAAVARQHVLGEGTNAAMDKETESSL